MKPYLFFLCSILIIAGCKRDNKAPGKPGISGDSVFLTKLIDSTYSPVNKLYVDSSTYSYDAAGRLMNYTFFYSGGTYVIGRSYSYSRDDQNRTLTVTRADFRDGLPDSNGLPPTINELHYAPATDQVRYGIYYFAVSGRTRGDSDVYSYTGNYPTEMQDYFLAAADPVASVLTSTWTYDGSGQMKTFDLLKENAQSHVEYSYQFDGKVNPLKLGAEALDFDVVQVSAGNPVTTIAHSPFTNSSDTTITRYSYRPDGRPVRSVTTYSARTDTKVTTWYYSK